VTGSNDRPPARDVLYASLILAAIMVGLLILWLLSIDSGSTGID
jgi:hypothetical protein